MAVMLGETQRLPARLLAVRVPQEVAATRRRRLREAARKKGRQASTTRLALAAWTLLVTNVPGDRLTLREALVLARVRWQIELLCKLWKSHGGVDESRSTQPWRMLCEVYAKLLAMLVQHWVFLVSCWAYPNRSLVKAAQTVQKHALHLASTFGSLRRLLTALSTVQRCVAAGCRMNRRKKHPNTHQLLFNDLSMTTALA
jgi:Transposase DDE domain